MSEVDEKEENEESELGKRGFRVRVFNTIINKNNRSKNIGFPIVVLKKSQDDSLKISIVVSALAESREQARKYARNIRYSFDVHDSVIELPRTYQIPKEDKFHFQRIKVIIEVPQNRYVYLSKNTVDYLYDIENNVDADEAYVVGKKWMMGIDCLQCIERCDEIGNTKKQYRKSKKHKDEQAYEEDEE